MPVRPNKAAPPATLDETPSGYNPDADVIVTDLSVFKGTPHASTPTVFGLDDLDSILDHHVSDIETVPPLNRVSVDVQGRKGSGKSILFAGSPHVIYLKLPDGAPTFRRSRARIIPIRHLEHFNETMESILSYARTNGITGKYTQVVIDPISILADWMLEEEGNAYNETNSCDITHYRLIPNGEKFLYPMVGNRIAKLLSSISACGWGWVTNTHYTFGLNVQNGTMSGDWKPDIPRSIAQNIEKMADVPLMVQKLINGDDDEYSDPDETIDPAKIAYLIEFEHKRAPQIGGRLPFYGRLEIPNMNSGKMPQDLCPYDYLNAAYEVAREIFLEDEGKFIAAQPKASSTNGKVVATKKKLVKKLAKKFPLGR